MGEDRAEALKVLDNDEKFDRWMDAFERKREVQQNQVSGNKSPNKSGKKMSKEEYIKRYKLEE